MISAETSALSSDGRHPYGDSAANWVVTVDVGVVSGVVLAVDDPVVVAVDDIEVVAVVDAEVVAVDTAVEVAVEVAVVDAVVEAVVDTVVKSHARKVPLMKRSSASLRMRTVALQLVVRSCRSASHWT